MFNTVAKRNAKAFIELSMTNQVDKLVIMKDVREIYVGFDTLGYIKQMLISSSFIRKMSDNLRSRVSVSNDLDYIISEVSEFNIYFDRSFDYRSLLSEKLPTFTGGNNIRDTERSNLKVWLINILTQYDYIDDITLTYAFKNNLIRTNWNWNFNLVIVNSKKKIIEDGTYINNKISKYQLSGRKMPLKEYDSIIQRYSNIIDKDGIERLSQLLEK